MGKLRDLGAAIVLGGLVVLSFSGCSKDYCGELSKEVCAKVPNTKACQKAKGLTDKETCKGYLADVDKYIKLMNLKVTTPPLKPPTPPKKAEKKEVQKKNVQNTVEKKAEEAKDVQVKKDTQPSATQPEDAKTKEATTKTPAVTPKTPEKAQKAKK